MIQKTLKSKELYNKGGYSSGPTSSYPEASTYGLEGGMTREHLESTLRNLD